MPSRIAAIVRATGGSVPAVARAARMFHRRLWRSGIEPTAVAIGSGTGTGAWGMLIATAGPGFRGNGEPGSAAGRGIWSCQMTTEIKCAGCLREPWAAYDLETEDGIKIEVKSSAYSQAWHQKKKSAIAFGVRETRRWDADTGALGGESDPAGRCLRLRNSRPRGQCDGQPPRRRAMGLLHTTDQGPERAHPQPALDHAEEPEGNGRWSR